MKPILLRHPSALPTLISKTIHAFLAFGLVFAAVQPAAAQVADPNTLTGKLVAGYQGWFGCPGDGQPNYIHWSRSGSDIGPGLYTVDMWPDITEYTTTFTTPNVTLQDASIGALFSSRTPQTVDKHWEWMKQHGIDGGFVQRFVVGVSDPPAEGQVLQNARAAANAHGRVFAVEYDTSGTPEAQVYQKITDDWKHLIDTANITNDPRYLHHNGKPVVIIWGLFDDRYSINTVTPIQDFFKNDPVYGNNYCIGGTPGGWRTVSTTGWPAFYRGWHCIHPWTVGAYMTNADILNWKNNILAPDLTECNSLGIQYLPVCWPGFSWDNLMQLPPGTSNFPRRGGQHLWDQVYHFESAGLSQMFIAMFDEVDESTAIFKVTSNYPTTDHWIGLEGYPNDWYMRLAGSAGQMVRGEITLSQTIPIDTYTCGDDSATDLGTTDVNDGMSNVQTGDGDTIGTTIGGRTCKKNVNSANDFYIYFEINDGQSFQGNCPIIYIRFDYYDTGSGSIQLQYDSIAGGAYKNGPSVTVGNTNTWKQTTFNVTDAYFGNRQNDGADFRLSIGTNITRYIDVVRVSNKDPVGIFTATPTSGNTPLLVNFNGTASYDPDGSINLYSWDFGDGATATGSTTSHTYVYGGSITASFTVRDNQGRTDTETVLLSITGPPSPASNPSPANGASSVLVTADLTWTAGSGASSHDVRFGTANPPPFVINQTATTYDPGTLANGTTYYWRVDEVNAQGTTTGPVWSFTTAAALITFSNSTFDTTADNWNIAVWRSGPFLDGTMAWDGTVGNPAGSMKSGGSGATNNDDSCTREGGEINKVISTVGYSAILVDYDVRFSTDMTGTACAGSCIPNVMEGDCADKLAVYYSTAGTGGPWTLIEELYASSLTQGVFSTRNLNLVAVTAANNNANFALRLKFQVNTAADNAYLDNIKVSGFQTGSPPDPATNPNPANGATGVSGDADVSWTAGSGATSHDVRFGTANPPPFVQNQTATTYDPGTLSGSTTYYWRIDEKNSAGTTTGTVWSFTTASPPAAPTVTVPTSGSTVTTLAPAITWTGAAHDGYQVRISQQNDSNTSTNGWDSGDVTGTGNSAVSGTLRDFSFYYVFVRLRNTAGWGAWSASGYNFIVNTNSLNGTVYLGNSLPTANSWQVYDTSSFENGSGITSTIVSDGGSNVWKMFDNTTSKRCKEKYSNGMNIDFTTGASCAARMRVSSTSGTLAFNLGITNGNVGGHYLRLYTNEVRLVDNAGNNRGSYLLGATVHHKYHMTVKNATPGNNATATWRVYVDGTLRITYTGAGTQEGYDGFFAGHAGTSGKGTWWFDNISGRNDGEFTPAQWDPVY